MKKTMTVLIEPLESRIAPAGLHPLTSVPDLNVSADGKKATWTDVDGDHVTLAANKPVFSADEFHFIAQIAGDVGYQLGLLDLSNVFTTGLNLTFTAQRDPVTKLGDGFVNVGWLDAVNSDLGVVTIPGDLGQFTAGDSNPITPGVASLTVHSAGAFGATTQDAQINGHAVTVDWIINGRLGALTVKGEFAANLNVLSNTSSTLGSTGPINIWGNLLANSGSLTASTTKGCGYLFSSGAMGPVHIGGSVFGSTGDYSGSIISNTSIASIYVGRDVFGGSGDYSGAIFSAGPIASVFIGGSLVSGSARTENNATVPSYAAGSIGSEVNLAKVTILGNATGGESYYGGSIFNPDQTSGKIGTVTIGGVLSGSSKTFTSGQTTTLIYNGIYSDSTLGAVKLGALIGQGIGSPVHIVALGAINPTSAAKALAIAGVTVVGGVVNASILAGMNAGLNPMNPDVQIGAIKVGNSWQTSSVAAGVASENILYFGGTTDTVIVPAGSFHDNPAIPARIGSIAIGGYVAGSFASTDSFAFESQVIGSVKIGSTVIGLTPNGPNAPLDDLLLGVTHDVHIREL